MLLEFLNSLNSGAIIAIVLLLAVIVIMIDEDRRK